MGNEEIDKQKIRKRLIILAISVVLVIAVISVSYAYFSPTIIEGEIFSTTGSVKNNSVDVTFTSDTDGITLSNTYPMTDEEGATTSAYQFTVTNNESTRSVEVKIVLEAAITNQLDSSLVKVLVDGENPTIITDFTTTTANTSGYEDAYILTTFLLKPGESKTTTLQIYIDESGTLDNAASKLWASKVVMYAGETNLAKTINTLGITVNNDTSSLNYNAVESSSGGVYPAQDNYGISYYYRGNVTNNYVYFAGYYWRIIRINGDGSVRIIYDGDTPYSNGTSSSSRVLTTSAYNSESSDNAYVGYMYGTLGASLASSTHTNTTSSTIKNALETWYESNIKGTEYEYAISDEIFCGDRSISSGNGYGTETTSYASVNRLTSEYSPSLVCSSTTDSYTVSDTTNGNGTLTYPIGLITADEVVLAGGTYGTSNTGYYLYKGYNYWTMTPYSYSSSASVWSVSSTGSATSSSVTTTNYLAPVINLSYTYIQQATGSGTTASPYTVED